MQEIAPKMLHVVPAPVCAKSGRALKGRLKANSERRKVLAATAEAACTL